MLLLFDIFKVWNKVEDIFQSWLENRQSKNIELARNV